MWAKANVSTQKLNEGKGNFAGKNTCNDCHHGKLKIENSSSGTSSTAGSTCKPPNAVCGTACVDVNTDAKNCGGCGNACKGTSTCVAGVCSCPAGTQRCCGGDICAAKCPKVCP